MSHKTATDADMQAVFHNAVVKAILAMGKAHFEQTSFFASNWHTKKVERKEAA